MPEPDRVTLAQIASEAGVSIATLSKVLNGRTDVAPATRARLEDQLHRHGYTKRGRPARNPTLELVLHELEATWSMEIVAGVEETARRAGLSVILTVSGDRHSPADNWVEGVLRRRPTGVVLVFSDPPARDRETLISRGIPFVIVDPTGDPAALVPSIGSSNWSGGLMATRHLIDLGHRRIAAITGPDDMLCSRARLDGYRAAMNAAALPIDPAWIRSGDFHPTSGGVEARALLALPEPPTAIFAGSDLQAAGVLAAANEAGVPVPRALSVVGYDDIALARWLNPPLTTVHQPLRRMGEEATRLVLRLADGETVDTLRTELSTHLVARGSTAPPAA